MGWDKIIGEIVECYVMEGEGVFSFIKGGGIWMFGGGFVFDDVGSIFFVFGNGYVLQLVIVFVVGFNFFIVFEQVVVYMIMNEDGSLDVVDFFMFWEK